MLLRAKGSIPALFLSPMSILVIGCSQSGLKSIMVFAAGGAKSAFDEICRAYEAQHGAKVEISYGGGR